MDMKRRIITGLVAGATAAVTLALPAQAAVPKAEVVFSSSTYLTSDFSVHGRNLAVLACTTVTEVRADGSAGALPWPGCSARVESDGGGVAYSRDGAAIAKTMTVRQIPTQPATSSLVVARTDQPESRVDVSAREYAGNPDGRARYGTTSTKSCVVQGLGSDASYTGRLDSAVPAVAAGPSGSWYVADRDGNTVYRVSRAGKVSVLAVLPPVTVTVSNALAAAANWPSCVVGTKVAFEAAPTEVEVGSDGTVYVAGEPRLASGVSAGTSVIYAIRPASGKVVRLAQRYAGQVDLAPGTKGRLFVARPEAGRISVIRNGRSQTHLRLPRVLAVETDDRGRLYAVRGAGASATDPASVVRIS